MSPLFGPDPEKILRSGTPVPGIVVGIEIKRTSDDTPTPYGEYAVETVGRMYGIRQDLDPFDEVRLGMPVTLRVDGKSAVIQWRDSGTYRWKMLRTPPERGIVDDHDENWNRGALSRARKGGRAATATILEIVTRTVMGVANTLDLRVRVDPAQGEPYETTVPNFSARMLGYAAHLPIVGARLPAWETKGPFVGERLMIDWPAAAMAMPGVDAPNAELPRAGLFVNGGVAGRIVDDTEAVATDQAPPAGQMPEIPEYAKNLMRKMGVDPDKLS